MKLNVLISCPHLQRTIDHYRLIFEKNDIAIETPEVNQQLTEDELFEIIDRYDGIIAGDDKLSAKVLEKAERLKFISKWGVGIDSIDLRAAKKCGIGVSNTPNVFSEEVADLVIGYIVALVRKTHIIDRRVHAGEWTTAQIQGRSLRGKKLGVIGVGSIGRAVVERAIVMGMEVVGFDVLPVAKEFIQKTGMNQVSLDELLRSADIISVNCNLTDDNYHLLSFQEFSNMKDQVIIINTARGPLIDEKALVQNLKKGKIAGVALDVFEDEPLSDESPLQSFENCIFGAHNSSNTYEAVMRVNELAINNLINGLKGRDL